MKIAMFSDYFYPELGGIQDSIAITSRELGRRGHLVDIYVPRYGKRDYGIVGAAPDKRIFERALGPNVRVHRRLSLPFPSSTRQSRATLPSAAGWATLGFFIQPDIIHAHSFFGLGLEALLNAAMLRKPVIGTNHTTVAGFAGHMPFSAARAAAYVTWFHNRCDLVTAPSKSVFAELGAENLRRPLEIVSNPIDTGVFVPISEGAGAALRQRLGLRGPVITYAGRLGPEKNIDVLLHAVAALRDKNVTAELAIAGHGSHEPILRMLAVELRIVDQVKFFGTLTHASLAQLFQISDTFAIMSTSETQSMVLLQAMAAGVPVVAADCRALPEFVGDDNGVLVNPGDAGRLADVLEALLASPARRRRLGAGGRARALQHGVGPVTDTWERLYNNLAAPRRAA